MHKNIYSIVKNQLPGEFLKISYVYKLYVVTESLLTIKNLSMIITKHYTICYALMPSSPHLSSIANWELKTCGGEGWGCGKWKSTKTTELFGLYRTWRST